MPLPAAHECPLSAAIFRERVPQLDRVGVVRVIPSGCKKTAIVVERHSPCLVGVPGWSSDNGFCFQAPAPENRPRDDEHRAPVWRENEVRHPVRPPRVFGLPSAGRDIPDRRSRRPSWHAPHACGQLQSASGEEGKDMNVGFSPSLPLPTGSRRSSFVARLRRCTIPDSPACCPAISQPSGLKAIWRDSPARSPFVHTSDPVRTSRHTTSPSGVGPPRRSASRPWRHTVSS